MDSLDLHTCFKEKRTILSTKTLSSSQKNLLLNANLQFVEYNAIKIEFLDFHSTKTILENAIITSKNSAKAILDKQIEITNCFCVGDKTAASLQENGYFVKETANYGSELGTVIAEKYREEKFSFFCGNKRRPELPSILKENKVDFEEIEVYKTSLNFRDFEQEFDGILFFSPSAVKSFTKENKLAGIPAFCIGKTTAAEAEKHTKKIITATKPSIENVIVQVVKYFKT